MAEKTETIKDLIHDDEKLLHSTYGQQRLQEYFKREDLKKELRHLQFWTAAEKLKKSQNVKEDAKTIESEFRDFQDINITTGCKLYNLDIDEASAEEIVDAFAESQNNAAEQYVLKFDRKKFLDFVIQKEAKPKAK